MRYAIALALLAAVVMAQDFPFNNGPLEESLHSNKVFFDITDVKEIAGVWQGINVVFHAYLLNDYLYDGVSPFNVSCAASAEGGWDYDHFIIGPRAVTIEVDPERLEEGVLGYFVASEYGATDRSAILDFTDEELKLDDDTCMPVRAYLDWELGKTMFIRNHRSYYYPGEDGTNVRHVASCDHDGEDHPTCSEGTFMIDGEEREAVRFDSVAFYECIAGPCLDLPHTIPEFVQTQGYVPAFRQQQVSADAGK